MTSFIVNAMMTYAHGKQQPPAPAKNVQAQLVAFIHGIRGAATHITLKKRASLFDTCLC